MVKVVNIILCNFYPSKERIQMQLGGVSQIWKGEEMGSQSLSSYLTEKELRQE